MTHQEALELIRGGVVPGGFASGRAASADPASGGTWADLGAGSGTFTRALAVLLGPDATVHAIDQSAAAVRELAAIDIPGGAAIIARQGDFTQPLDLPSLDGVLMANALHFTPHQEEVLRHIVRQLAPGGRVLMVEYDRARGNRWVPHPIPFDRLRTLAETSGLSEPREVGRRRSAYWREMYAAVSSKE